MTPVKIIFFDIDGTLVNPKTGHISDNTLLALTRLRERGIKICISTGRAPSEVPDFGPLKFDAYCTYNGSLCYANNEILHSNPIAPADVAQVLKNAAGIGRPVSVAVRNRLAANGWDPDLADYYRLAKLELTVAPDFDAACQENVYQILIGCREAEHAALIQGAHGVKIAVSWDRAVDVIPASSGKGTAIAKVLAHFGLEASQAMAFGDSQNDLDMFKAVGVGVAMGNATSQLKAVADDVCGAVSDDGIYHYCLEHGLIG
ncbi:MAG: Cof-type HAD-IIB family hydrolase [Clostridiales bacterium]|nr:Cof-type HAD-IIB family hydrolase [Clostridiales bacterium]